MSDWRELRGLRRPHCLGGLRSPKPSHRVGIWGNPVSPSPCARAAPSQTLLRTRAWGNPVSPSPCARASPSQTLPAGGDMGKSGFPIPLRKGCAPPNPPAGGGRGKPGFSIPLRKGYALQTLLRAGAGGNPVSPYPLLEGVALPDPPAGGGMGEPGSPMFTLAPCTEKAKGKSVHHLSPSAFCLYMSLVGVGGLEPPTSILSGSRSNRLSYTPLRHCRV